MQLKLVSLEPPDAKHPSNTKAIAFVEFSCGNGESIVVGDFRVISSFRSPDRVIVPVRFGPNNNHYATVLLSRQSMRQVEDLILAAWGKKQLAALDAQKVEGAQ